MSIKLERLGNIFVEAISKVIHEEVKDDDIKFVTITAVDISSDLSYAKVYFTNLIDADREKCVNVKGINTDRKLADVRKKFSNEEISLHGRTKVGNIESYFWKELGIACQIGICNYCGHSHYFPIGSFNGLTLTAANDWAKSVGCKKVTDTEINQISRGTIF